MRQEEQWKIAIRNTTVYLLSMKSSKKHGSEAVGLSHSLNVVLIHTDEIIIEKIFLTTVFGLFRSQLHSPRNIYIFFPP